MKLSNRLLACAAMVRPGSSVVDVGTDHGHLPIYLLQQGICVRAIASDLRPKPLQAARDNAALEHMGENLSFCLSDGLKDVPMDGIDTVVCAGMGGDTIRDILLGRKDCWRPELTYILQPQAAVAELRGFLSEQTFSILRERFARDGGFVYTVMEVKWGSGVPLTPGQRYFPQGNVDRGDPLYSAYMSRVRESLQKTVTGIRKGRDTDENRLRYFETALAELTELEERYGNGT